MNCNVGFYVPGQKNYVPGQKDVMYLDKARVGLVSFKDGLSRKIHIRCIQKWLESQDTHNHKVHRIVLLLKVFIHL